ncbi:hypothetical protein BZA05DRAFT_340193 [Tricharina praecox]|uniref:uncharacterized protein n=1 Tax=Tricharina praecox TaxID=43433 RepID=UPI00221EA859|nr:uncharacterized protein BZA05DRAFT_340193 [Tricharina praecox]KAI5848226.1 hypothetical protein BZA05DRAFT_340193 [Tricharina praecox]
MPATTIPTPKTRGSSRGHAPENPTTADSSSQNIEIQRQSLYGVVNSSTESLCTGYMKVNCFTGTGSSRNDSVRSAMKTAASPLMDCTDFDSLPPAVKRKYFSSLERLRFAQHSAAPPKSSGHLRNLSSASGRLMGSRMRSRPSTDSSRNQFRKHRNAADAFVLSQSDAQWFLELPENIRKKHFSREERILLATKCESIIVDAADETLYRMNCRPKSMDSISTTSDIGSLYRPSFESDVIRAREEMRMSFRWMEEDGDLDLRLQPFQEREVHSAPPPRNRKRRTLSLSSKRTNSSSSTATATSLSRPCLSRRAASTPKSSGAPPSSAFSCDSEATYYQDPEARLKLRVYLASPQKFDEAIEFGFPSQTDAHNFFKLHPGMPTIRRVPPEDSEDPLIEEGEDAEEVAEVADTVPESPMRMRSSGSNSCRALIPVILDHYPHTSPGNREMTLKMTLTRKDLRDDDGRHASRDGALALEELPPEGEQCNVDWDAIDKESASGLKRLWRKVKRH